MIKFTVPGRPVPAVRMTRKGKYVKRRAQEYLEYKKTVGWSAKAAGVRLTNKSIGIKIIEIEIYKISRRLKLIPVWRLFFGRG